MRKKRIHISIVSIVLILAGVLAGIVLYGNDILRREMFNYGWQMSRSVHTGIAQASRRDFAAFEASNDSLVSAFLVRNGGRIDADSLNLDSARALVEAHKTIYLRYFHDKDSVKSLLSQAGFDTSFGLKVEIGFFGVMYHNRELVPLFDSLLHKDSLVRTIYNDAKLSNPEFYTRGIRIRGEHFRVDYRAFIYPYHLRNEILKRVFPIFILLTVAFLAMVFFFLFTIRTMLKQQRISDQKTDFINNITHEFNTPLATIAVVTKMLQQGAGQLDSGKLHSMASMIDRQNHLLQQMVNTIMQFSDVVPETTAAIPLIFPAKEIEKILEDFRIRNSSEPIQVNARLEIDPQTSIRMDPTVFSNVLHNILDNALKYRSGEREPAITVTAVLLGEMMEIAVTDNGAGIKKDQLKYIFEKFYRIPAGDLHNVKGMGLGLYFVKKNVESAGGKIRVESTRGNGSTFFLRFPLAV